MIHLRLKSQFQKVISNYQASQQAQELLAQARIALFDGPSASGRNTIIAELLKTGKYQQIISDTTRPRRSNNGILEQNGVEYWFKSEEDFLDGLKNGAYIEAAIIHDQQVSGVSVREIERIGASNTTAINDVQPDGIEAFRRYNPNIWCFFIIPPSFEVWEARLLARGTISESEKRRRFKSALDEIEHALAADYYTFITNDDLDSTVKVIDAICSGKHMQQNDARLKARQLADAIKLHLANN